MHSQMKKILLSGCFGDNDDHRFHVPATNSNGVNREKIKIENSRCFPSFCIVWVKKFNHWQRVFVKCKRETRKERENGPSGLIGEVSSSVCGESKVGCEPDEPSVYPGRYMKEASFSLGVGFGLVYHNVAFRDELNKMIELRGQMQLILQNLEEALGTKKINPISRTSSLRKVVAYSLDASECGLLQKVSPLSNQADSRTTFVCDQSLECDTTTQEIFSEGMDQLEEELEAELERLQIHLDTELMLNHKEEGRLQMNVVGTAPGASLSARFKEVVDPSEAEARENNGVSPSELERRLHELLESRQEQRIKELEAALECVKRKLSEKEKEIYWWKNTASIISKHVPEPPHLHL